MSKYIAQFLLACWTQKLPLKRVQRKAFLMNDPEADQRNARQRRALQVRPGGACVDPVYISRTEEYVGVSRNDLKDFMELDSIALLLLTLGSFFASGAFWLAIEHAFETSFAKWDLQISFCALAIVFGAALAYAGIRMHGMKRRRITAVFNRDGNP